MVVSSSCKKNSFPFVVQVLKKEKKDSWSKTGLYKGCDRTFRIISRSAALLDCGWQRIATMRVSRTLHKIDKKCRHYSFIVTCTHHALSNVLIFENPLVIPMSTLILGPYYISMLKRHIDLLALNKKKIAGDNLSFCFIQNCKEYVVYFWGCWEYTLLYSMSWYEFGKENLKYLCYQTISPEGTQRSGRNRKNKRFVYCSSNLTKWHYWIIIKFASPHYQWSLNRNGQVGISKIESYDYLKIFYIVVNLYWPAKWNLEIS